MPSMKLIILFIQSQTFTKYILSFRYADDISIGDDVLVQRNAALIPEKVIDISRFTMQGKFLHITLFMYLP